MADVARIKRDINKEWRIKHNKVGEALTYAEKELIEEATIKKIAAVKKAEEQTEVVEKEKAAPSSKPDPEMVSMLGVRTRVVTRTEMVQAVDRTGRPMMGDKGPIMTMKSIAREETIKGSDLDFDEAKKLGKQLWSPLDKSNGTFTCRALGIEGIRRFVIDRETHERLCQI